MEDGQDQPLVTLWDFGDPAGSERRFRDLLAAWKGPSDAARPLEIRTQIARALGLQQRYLDALRELDAVEAALAGPPAGVRVRCLLERGRVRNTSGSPAEARPLFEEAFRAAGEAGLDGLAVDAAHMVAIVADTDDAIAWNERALDLARTSADPDAQRWKGSLLNNLGWTYHDLGQFARAHALFEEALEARLAQGDAGLVRVARWCVARAFRSLGRLEEALAMQQKLAAEHETAGTRDGFVHEELAECLHALGRAEEARPHFGQAAELLSADPWLPEQEPDRLKRLRRMAETT